ncbi:methylmalonyl Co-A mutase-associated GTPase MeaB [Deferribacterales bacterium RsTz2092]|nr:ATPase/protein kinase [Deferribacterales bacterium]
MSEDVKKPEWASPEWAGAEGESTKFASRVMAGVEVMHDGELVSSVNADSVSTNTAEIVVRDNYGAPPKLDVSDYVEGIKQGNRGILARAITLVESNKLEHMNMAQNVLQEVLPLTGRSLRIGITGVPGAGKSTLIEALGTRLCDAGHKVAVLAVDPSSTITKGSILGDRTRMEQLVRRPNAFVRPSPSAGALGGVARKSRETLLLCEAAGYDVSIVETVGVGQSEITVRSMVDAFLFVVLTGAGDELQGMKKGVMEIADIIAVNKADGDNKERAERARSEYEMMVHYLRQATEGWTTPTLTCSALTHLGMDGLWDTVERFFAHVKSSGVFERRRREQSLSWFKSMIEEHLYRRFYDDDKVKALLPEFQAGVESDTVHITRAVQQLLDAYESR